MLIQVTLILCSSVQAVSHSPFKSLGICSLLSRRGYIYTQTDEQTSQVKVKTFSLIALSTDGRVYVAKWAFLARQLFCVFAFSIFSSSPNSACTLGIKLSLSLLRTVLSPPQNKSPAETLVEPWKLIDSLKFQLKFTLFPFRNQQSISL